MIYDAFQEKAIQYTEKGSSVIVCAPTGAGKTAIAEHVIEKCIDENKGVIYTAPIKALSNQKFRDFSKVYGDHIGILTGDVSLNAHAPVLIMTTEIFRNTLLEDPKRFSNISWVIFDEVHYLDDTERGTVWEESIMFCPPHIRILALSATIPNATEVANWIKKIHDHPIEIVSEKKRPVPLTHWFQCENRIFSNTKQLEKNIHNYFGQKRSSRKKHYKHKYSIKSTPNKLSSMLTHMQNQNQLPAIYFAFSRKRCEGLAHKVTRFNFLTRDEQDKLSSLFENLIKKFGLENEPSAQKLTPLIKKGIAYHHAGLLPSLKEVIEQLFTSRLIKLIFTTETFALGINMPAKTVVFDELRKFYGYYHANLRCRDYYQMAGRAGRRGIDKEGFVYSRINPKRMDTKQIKKIIFGQPEPILSQFNISYATILHLYRKWNEKLYNVYPLTLHYFQSSKKARRNALDLMQSKVILLKNLGYIKNNTLSYKGEFASQLYGYELPITELFSSNILEGLSSIDLNIVLAALVFEPRKNQLHTKLSSAVLKTHNIITPVIDSILKAEKKQKIRPISKKPYFNLARAIEKWSCGEEFAALKEAVNADEGEIVRYFRMVIQILRQLRGISFISPEFKQSIQESIIMLNRDEVDAEKQLREGIE
ncbi:MAG: DEAD/DEAH box helicase [PVC group bacterium]|nr:DEAD/DEAH box helicase [PVC group bacterium]